MGRKRREYTYEEYMKAMELLEKGYGLTETCRLLGWPEARASTLYCWKHGRIPPLARWRAEPTKELAYVIGVLHGDGSVCKDEFRHRYIIELGVKDKEFAETFSKVMAKLLDMSYREPYWNEKDKVWHVAYDSKAFFEWYEKTKKQGLEGFKKFVEYNRETVRYYLRGLFDGEGNNNGNKQIRLTNTNKELLEYVQYLLKKYFNIKATGPYLRIKAGTTVTINGVEYKSNYDYYAIVISRKLHVQDFLKKIGFTIVRKQLGLKKYEKIFMEGIGYVEPYRLVELGLFKLPFNGN